MTVNPNMYLLKNIYYLFLKINFKEKILVTQLKSYTILFEVLVI